MNDIIHDPSHRTSTNHTAPHHNVNFNAPQIFRPSIPQKERKSRSPAVELPGHTTSTVPSTPATAPRAFRTRFKPNKHEKMPSAVRALATLALLCAELLLFCAGPSVAAADLPERERLRATAAAARRSANDIALLNDDEAAREIASENELFFLRAGEDEARRKKEKRKKKRRKHRL
eukprot:CAMPEP_0194297914 /NCGR_PEP_ID=MMETSP0169-20130528/59876_1 /TAXON_ID=218684 /ORGANISM="Corethron pennatum, Strain L29A3" /LENGTH=175 /DNA_ID=CAMNT_0039047843 /DNA_START=51 /DNA_END=578 /DNA_ORIENTATION=+